MFHRPIGPIAVLCLVAAGYQAAAQQPDVPARGRLLPSFRDTVAEAAARLEEPGCRQILTDFRDVAGRSLEDRLKPTGLDAPAYVRSVEFRAGRGVERCQTARVLLFTTIGGHVIWVCEAQYYRKEREGLDVAVALVLHEVLHTLGLGEDPPSSAEITARVLARCARHPHLLASR